MAIQQSEARRSTGGTTDELVVQWREEYSGALLVVPEE